MKDFVRDEIAGPLGADFQIGARPKRLRPDRPAHPAAAVRHRPFDALPEDSPMRKTLTNPAPPTRIANTAAWRDADIGAVNGHGNARSLARMLSPISLGGDRQRCRTAVSADDRQDLRRAIRRARPGAGRAAAVRHRLRPAAPRRRCPSCHPEERVCFWGGWGGSMVLINPDRRTTAAYVMNKMGQGTLGNERTARYARLIYEAIS